MDRDRLTVSIKQHEGTGPRASNGNFLPYTDTTGNTTIGWGHNLSAKGISPPVAQTWLDWDIDDAIADATKLMPLDIWNGLNDVRQNVLVELCFEMDGGVAKFYHMLAAIHDGRWDDAANEMLNSKWGGQVHARADVLAQMMRTGEWPS